MTPKEKAGDLIEKFRQNQFSGCIICSDSYEDKDINAKSLALIAVDEILNSGDKNIWGAPAPSLTFWQQVRKEIELL